MLKLRTAYTLTLVIIAARISCAAQADPKNAKDFFPGLDDHRKVVYIETTDNEVLVFDEKDNATYVLGGRALEIIAPKIQVHGNVVIRSFADGSHGADTPGVGSLGAPGGEGAVGDGDGQQGHRGGRGGRGGTGAIGGTGSAAKRMKVLVTAVEFTPNSSLKLDNRGQDGGKGLTGGQGGTGGRGGHGQNRTCGSDAKGPGNAGPKGAAGAQGTGGQGGPGGSGGDIFLSDALWKLKDQSVLVDDHGGKGGQPGDPGALGLVGQPGVGGQGSGCGGGGEAKDEQTAPEATEAYVPSPSSVDGQPGAIKCADCQP